MANYTSNYKLTKPTPNELYNIDIQNNNMDNVDTNLKKTLDVANEANSRSKTNESNLEALKTFQEDPFEETGSIVQVDLFQDAPLNVVTHIEPVQAGSGDPYPAGGGKNKISLYFTENVIVTENADGTVTATNNTSSEATGPYCLLTGIPAGTYTVQKLDTAASAFLQRSGNSDYTTQIVNNTPITFEYDGTSYLRVKYENIPATSSVTYKIQLEAGSTATDFAPYSNIRPISGRTSAKLTRCGKNLLPPAVEKIIVNNGVTFTSDGQGRYTINGTATGENAVVVIDLVKPITIGKVSPYCHLLNPVANGNISFSFIRPDGTQITWLTTSSVNRIAQLSQLAGETISKINLYLAKDNTANNFTLTPMFCMDDVPAAFAPYQGDTFTADFGQTIYGGTLDWNTGVLTVGWKLARLTSDGTWSKSSTAKNGYYLKDSNLIPGKLPFTEVRCNVAKYTPDLAEYRNTYNRVYTDNTVSISIDPAVCGNTLDSFKAWLDANEIVIAYKLNTPTTIQLTAHELSALAGLNTLYSDCGDTTVSGRKDIIWLTHSLIKRIEALESQVAGL